MPPREFEQLVARLNRESEQRPELYRIKLLALTALGHLYILALLLLSSLLLLWGLTELVHDEVLQGAKLLLLGSIAGIMLWRSTRINLPAPQGQALLPADAPQLFGVIEKIRSKLGGPPIHRVVVNDLFNAAIFQAPRLGIFGWHRNTLIIGLPLMQALSRKEFAAILAHEYAHLSRQHGRLDTWIYHTRLLWSQVQASFRHDSSLIEAMLTRFLRGYIPLFQAYSLVQARRDEYEADRLAASVVGAQTMADALIAQAIRGRFIEERFWQDLWSQASSKQHPPYLPHTAMRTALHLGLPQEDAQRWFDEALQHYTGAQDTHPSLRDRILALDTGTELPPNAVHSAAQSLLGDLLPRLQQQFDELWLSHNEQTWRLHHHAAASARETVQRMQGRDAASLSPEELSHYALALDTLGRKDEALPLLCQAADHPHGSADSAMAAARLLRERGDEALTHYLQLAVRRNRELCADASLEAEHFYRQRGDEDNARLWGERLNDRVA
ncbi:M48 family metallopeptidase [Uliginosibacterium sp. TH139]|uniref:M48 family metallopeptidase n=1 Tax=Uliginosibacterium sp. TH139 TaxID=2067453 RepID=UPI000C7AF226|nr:M48 family metallopeptidase [Uliginosibacterium sp. TH139]PLK49604.1 hypothetical protein C0V76_04010 [Uliginosibacterium sp. TH139]